jgi:WD40 repeat protein
MSALKVFVSHTGRLARLPEGRSFVQAALDALAAADRLACDMRHFTADDRAPAQLCIETVRQCDVYVGLFGQDYGSPVCDRPEVSYTELEFLTALEEKVKRGMRVFAFLLDEKADEALGPLDERQASFRARQAAFRQRVLDSGIVTASFATPGDLQYRLHLALEKLPAAPSPDRRLQHMPYLPANFTGRQADLDAAERLVRDSLAGGAALSLVGFRGMGGIGKTALAAALAERLAADGRTFPGGVFWANLLDRAPEDVARDWVRDLGGDPTGLGPEACLTRFHELAVARRPLVVLDNVPRTPGGDGPAAKLLVRARGVATLLTTRFREAVPAGVSVREVEALLPEEAAALLRTHVGAVVEEDWAAAEVVLAQCGRLPLFVNAAGRAVANGYFTLAEYAEELRRRGLSALADEDEKAAAVFDLSWRFVSEPAREVFAALALAPGDDVGPNLVVAWLRQGGGDAGGNRAARLLADLANAALLISTDERARRYRYHDRVRDYALGKLALPREEVQRRLLACYTDWDMVRAEFAAVGAPALAGQYHRLRSWGGEELRDFAPWYHFVRGQAPALESYPELFFQQALNEPAESPVSRAAQDRVGSTEAPERWLEWVNRPREFVPPACLQVLTGHTSCVRAVVLTGDGLAALSTAHDGTVRKWDLARGRCRTILQGREGGAGSLAATPDGRVAVAGADDRHDWTLRVLDLAAGRCRARLHGHTGWVSSVAVTGDGRTALSGSYDETVRVWDLATGECRAQLSGHTDRVSSVAVTGDGRTALSGSHDETVRVWDLATAKCRATLGGHRGPVLSVAVAPDGRTAASAGDWTVRVWDLDRGHCRRTLEGHEGGINGVAVTGDGRLAVSGADDRTVLLWDLTSGECRAAFRGHTGEVNCVAMTTDGRLLVSGSDDRTLRVWDASRGLRSLLFDPETAAIESVRVTADGRIALVHSLGGALREYDLASGECRAVHGSDSAEAHIAWAGVQPGGSHIVDRRVHFLRLRAAGSWAPIASFPGNFRAVACSPDGQHVIAGDGLGQVYVLRLRCRDD